MTVRDLRDVLRERAERPSPVNPHRHEQVRSRIGRTRLRRRIGAGAAAVAAVVVAISLVPGAAEPVERETTTATSLPELPERFTAPDGTAYRRLAVAGIAATGPKATSVKVPVSGLPLDVAGLCDGPAGSETPRVSVDGKDMGVHGFAGCGKQMALRPLTVPAGTREITVTFDTTTSGGGCVQRTKDGPCVPRKPERADWSLAVYEWTPPARPVAPEPVRAMPRKLGGMRLISAGTGVFPGDTTFTARVMGDGGRIGIDQICSGDLAGRMWFKVRVGVQESPSAMGCGVWEKGAFPMAMQEFDLPKGEQVTITVRVGLFGAHTNRPVDWAIGIYQK